MAESFLIFAKYEPDEKFGTCAEHDEIYACHVPPKEMTEEDAKFLNDNGWDWNADSRSWRRFT
jgi:hypothetical protein